MGAAGMSGLAVRNQNGEAVHYTGSQFVGLENTGTHHLCVRTGPGADDVVKYGLTSAPLNDKYKVLKMKISEFDEKYAYIAQRYDDIKKTTISETYTTTSASNYVKSETLIEASTTKSTTTSISKSLADIIGTYYGSKPTISKITDMENNGTMTTTYPNAFFNKVMSASSSTTYDVLRASALVTINGFYRTLKANDLYATTRFVSGKNTTTQLTTTKLTINSKTKLITKNDTRPSNPYNTSSSATTNISYLTNNANL